MLIYQEQTMQIARDLAGFTMAESDKVRKAIGKKDKKLMASLGEKFIKGCQAETLTVQLSDGSTK
ncbi:hypothetical protein, partial [Vibrio parahaemolyticus]|uniref:hypothetical protein n=1 Tax=Vibrio parahaemolyticus TaxID=670 RepID=UPI00358EF652